MAVAPPAYPACVCGRCTLRYTVAELAAQPDRGYQLRCCGNALCVTLKAKKQRLLNHAFACARRLPVPRRYRLTPNKSRRFFAYRKIFFFRKLTNPDTHLFERVALLRCVSSAVINIFPLAGEQLTGFHL
jgi:hypothetical protein